MRCFGCQEQLVDLYENDCIFDKFDACFSASGSHVATGSYANCFRVVSRANGADATLEASRDPQRKRLNTAPSKACTHPNIAVLSSGCSMFMLLGQQLNLASHLFGSRGGSA